MILARLKEKKKMGVGFEYVGVWVCVPVPRGRDGGGSSGQRSFWQIDCLQGGV